MYYFINFANLSEIQFFKETETSDVQNLKNNLSSLKQSLIKLENNIEKINEESKFDSNLCRSLLEIISSIPKFDHELFTDISSSKVSKSLNAVEKMQNLIL
jgi:hypothetical protein